MNPTDLNFKITTSAELTALRETERELIKAVTAAKALGKADDLKKFGTELAGVQQRLAQFSPGQKITAEVLDVAGKVPVLGSAMTALNGSLGPVSIALAAGATALGTASKAVSAYADQESDVVKLNTALANSGQYSEEASAAVQELANQYKELTGIDDSKFLSAARTLLQFGADRSKLDAYLETVTNLAGIMGGDVEAAANLFGKALQGNTDVLGRYGIKVEAGATQTQKLDSIMQQAAARGAGQLTAGSETLNRKFGDLRLGTEDAVKGFGNLIARTGVVQFGLDAMRGGLLFLNNLLPETAKVSGDFANKVGQIGDNAIEAARKLDEARKAGESLADVKLSKLTEEAAAADRAFANLTAQIRATEQAQIALSDAKLARDLAVIDDKENTGRLSATGAADARFAAKQAAEREKTRLALASIDAQKAALIKAEVDKLKPELEKAKVDAEAVRKDAGGKTGALDVQASSIRATAPIKEEAAAIANQQAARDAAEKDRLKQEADDASAVERGLLGNADTLAKRAEPGVKAIGRDAKKSGNRDLFDAAKKAQEAIDATRDGTTEEEAQAVLATFQALTAELIKSNKKTAGLEKIVATLASQLKTLTSNVSNGRALD